MFALFISARTVITVLSPPKSKNNRACRKSGRHLRKKGNKMKILVAYSSKSGTTRECAEKLETLLPKDSVTLSDIENDSPSLKEFDVIAVGGYVRMGKMSKTFKRFISENEAILNEKPHAFFMCAGLVESTDYYFEKAIPRHLLNSSISNMCFGGDLRVKLQKGLDKIIARIILSSIKNHNADEDCDKEQMIPAILPENISRFADEIRRTL